MDKNTPSIDNDQAIWGDYSLINSDQGVRGLLQISNDIFYILSHPLNLNNWKGENFLDSDDSSSQAITDSILSLRNQDFFEYVKSLSGELANFDWRSPATPGISNDDRIKQQGFKGSSGYKEMRRRLALLLMTSKNSKIANAAKLLVENLK